MNTGIGDAMNLGWKLAAAVRGSAPPLAAGQLRGRAPSRRRQRAAADRRVQPAGAQQLQARGACCAPRSIGTRDPGALRQAADRANGSAGSASPIRTQRGDDWMVGRRMPDIDVRRQAASTSCCATGKFVLVTAAPVRAGSTGHRACRRRPSGAARRCAGPSGQLCRVGERTAADAAELAAAVDIAGVRRFRSSAATRTDPRQGGAEQRHDDAVAG